MKKRPRLNVVSMPNQGIKLIYLYDKNLEKIYIRLMAMFDPEDRCSNVLILESYVVETTKTGASPRLIEKWATTLAVFSKLLIIARYSSTFYSPLCRVRALYI